MFKKLQNIGPGALVAAAFIGPGTVTACTIAGADFGYMLLWALAFATFTTIVLQEMAARLGIITQRGLGDILVENLRHSMMKWPLIGLACIALYGGNAAYEAGNLAGSALGVEAIIGGNPTLFRSSIVFLTLIGGFILLRGSYHQIERFLVGLVMLMGLAFVMTFFVVQPSLPGILKGVFQPRIPEGSLMTIIALIGTTVVPYNLFLHASAVKAHWSGEHNLSAARTDTMVSIGLGGLIAMLITSTAAASMFAHGLSVNSANDMAIQLEPLFGSLSKYLLGMGLFAAGLSSTITAPLATSYALSEILQLEGGTTSKAFRTIAASILIIGATFSMADISPITLILLAQFANGLLLPIVACFLLYVMNLKTSLGSHTNGIMANILGGAAVLLTATLGARLIAKALHLM